MGNCLRHQSSMRYATDDDDDDEGDWDFPVAEKLGSFAATGGNGIIEKSKTTTTTTEVKIKITKKQLEELLGKVDVKDLKVDQVLSQLMKMSSRRGGRGGYQALQRSWRPALQSIPEVNCTDD